MKRCDDCLRIMHQREPYWVLSRDGSTYCKLCALYLCANIPRLPELMRLVTP